MISAVIAFRERKNNDNINYCIDYLSRCDNLGEILLVNQDTKKITRENILSNTLVRIIDNKYDGPFAKSWALNIGINQANNNIISIIDADCIMHRSYFNNAISIIDKWKNTFVLHGFIYTKNFEHAKTMPYHISSIRNECQGHVTAHIDTFKDVGGYNEKIRYWGFEDNDLINRLEYNGYIKINGCSSDEVVYHIHHEESDKSYNKKIQEYVRNDINKTITWGSIDKIPQFYF